jgi:hypothetical protein
MTKDLGVWTAGDCALVLIGGLHTGIDLVVDGGMKAW